MFRFKPYLWPLLLLMVLSQAAAEPLNVTLGRFADIAYFPQGSAPASVMSLNDAILSAQIQSSVEQISVKVGDIVKQGDTLLQLDCRKAKAGLQQAHSAVRANRARMGLAQYQLKRAHSLSKKNHVSEEILKTREAELAALQAEQQSLLAMVKIQKVDVEHCVVTAPFDGVIQQRMADVGEWVNVGIELLRLVDLQQLEVRAEIPALSVQQLQQVGEFAWMQGNQHYPLSLRSIAEVTNPAGRSRELRLQFNTDMARPGDSGRLLWRLSKRALPSDYLSKRDEQYGVLIAEGERAVFKSLPDAQEGRPVMIDLADDVMLIVKGRQSVRDGDVLQVVK